MKIEEMSSFFNKRVEGYEEHMKNNVDGADRLYKETAKLIPNKEYIKLLVLGCGTGLELDEIFQKNSTVNVTGIDIAEDMIEKLKRKHVDKLEQINIIVDDYIKHEFVENYFDVALSVQSLHHFEYDVKVKLYKKIYKSLRKEGVYIETDYMAPTKEDEDYYFAENIRIRKDQGIESGLYHYDIPYTVDNQIKMMKEAGFKNVDMKWKHGNTVILVASK